MTDLVVSFVILAAVSVGLFAFLTRRSMRWPLRSVGVCSAALLLSLIGFLLFVRDHLVLARILPASGILILGDLSFPLIAALAGVVTPHLSPGRRRRGLAAAILLSLGALAAIRPLLGGIPAMHNGRWEDSVCPQTSDSSCSAASAATLLAAAGIPATEPEMGALCLTRESGTSMLGVYRGLRRKTAQTPWSVQVLAGANTSTLRDTVRRGPVLLSVGLDRFQRVSDPRYTNQWGWSFGSYHAVVLFGFLPNGDLDIGDPAVGRERWHPESLDVLWHGEGLQLALR